MTYLRNRIFNFFLHELVENLILGKYQEKKVSEVSRFSGYYGFAGSPVFRKKLKLFLDKKFWLICIIYSFLRKFLVKKLFSETPLITSKRKSL